MTQTSSSQTSGIWFAISLGLMGVILGYGFATMSGATTFQPSARVAQQPTPTPTPTPTPSAAPAGTVKAIDAATDHIRGNKDAAVSVIVYSDFECPFCKRHHPTLATILETYGDDVNVVYRHYPLAFHPNAQPAAEASECITEIGGNDAFWKFADEVLGGDNYDYPAIAKKLGLDEAQFKTCLDSGKFKQIVTDQQQSGADAGIRGTPGNIVYNNKTKESKLVSGAVPFESFKAVIDPMLAE